MRIAANGVRDASCGACGHRLTETVKQLTASFRSLPSLCWQRHDDDDMDHVSDGFGGDGDSDYV